MNGVNHIYIIPFDPLRIILEWIEPRSSDLLIENYRKSGRGILSLECYRQNKTPSRLVREHGNAQSVELECPTRCPSA